MPLKYANPFKCASYLRFEVEKLSTLYKGPHVISQVVFL